jgi:hypothetical protein
VISPTSKKLLQVIDVQTAEARSKPGPGNYKQQDEQKLWSDLRTGGAIGKDKRFQYQIRQTAH